MSIRNSESPTGGAAAFFADGDVLARRARSDSYSQALLILSTGVAIGMMHGCMVYLFSHSVASSLYWVVSSLIFSGMSLALWTFAFPRFSSLSAPGRWAAQWGLAILSFALLSLMLTEAHHSVFGLGRGSILFQYGGGDVDVTIPADAIRRAPWLFAMVPIIPTAVICTVGFNQSWWRIFELREKHEEMRELAVAAQLAALRAQLNPHFLFNSLNSIAELVRTDPERAEECIERLAEILRYVLKRTQIDLVPFADELRIAQAYLEIEKARFGDALRVETLVDEGAGAVMLPGLTLQPLVENAVKHGISQKVGGGLITIEAGLDNGDLRLSVRDTGVGMRTTKAPFDRGFGLRNLRERLTRRYGPRYEPLVQSRLGEGTSITVRVPREVSA
jgi:signal transduction histidine kinase